MISSSVCVGDDKIPSGDDCAEFIVCDEDEVDEIISCDEECPGCGYVFDPVGKRCEDPRFVPCAQVHVSTEGTLCIVPSYLVR